MADFEEENLKLIIAASNQDADAWKKLCDIYRDEMVNEAVKVTDNSLLAEKAVDMALLYAYDHFDELNNLKNFVPWLKMLTIQNADKEMEDLDNHSWDDSASTFTAERKNEGQTILDSIPSGVLEEAGTGNTTPINQKEFTIGKLKNGSDLFIPSHTVSRHHAKITMKDNRYYLQDLHSLNHTFLNGKKLIPEKEYPLEDGDMICFDDKKFLFKLNN